MVAWPRGATLWALRPRPAKGEIAGRGLGSSAQWQGCGGPAARFLPPPRRRSSPCICAPRSALASKSSSRHQERQRAGHEGHGTTGEGDEGPPHRHREVSRIRSPAQRVGADTLGGGGGHVPGGDPILTRMMHKTRRPPDQLGSRAESAGGRSAATPGRCPQSLKYLLKSVRGSAFVLAQPW